MEKESLPVSLYIFDKDGTLVQYLTTRIGVKRAALTPEDQVLIPRVYEKLARLRAAGHKIAISSNQTSVAKGLITLKQAEALMENCASKIGGAHAWAMSPFDPHGKPKLKGRPNPYARDDPSRKPNPGMILDLMSTLHASPQETIVVGDSKVDRGAAEAAGARYIRAKEFFKKAK